MCRPGVLAVIVMACETPLTIEVVGAGTVGTATGKALEEWGHDVVFKDIDADVRADLADDGHRTHRPDEPVAADLSLVCVPTPYDEGSDTMRTHIVDDAIATLATQDPSVVAVRSTVPPTTTERLAAKYDLDHYGMVPEFLFEDTAREDIEQLDAIVVGAADDTAREVLKTAFAPQLSTYVEVTPTEAEFVKMAGNTFAATKISFANEMWRLVSETDERFEVASADPDTVLAGVRQVSPWFGPDMGMQGGWPYGGHCLPKDTRGLQSWAEQDCSVSVPQLAGTIAENDLVRSYTEQQERASTVVTDD